MHHDNLARPWIDREPMPVLAAQGGEVRVNDLIESPLTVRPDMRASSAIAMMREASTSAALVTRELRDVRYDRVVGLVTSQQLQQELLGRWEPELLVGDEMYPWEEVSIVNAASVRSLTAGQLYGMFRGTGLSHVVVVDNTEKSYRYVVGLLSRAALAQRLGHLVQRSRRRPEVALPDPWQAAHYTQH